MKPARAKLATAFIGSVLAVGLMAVALPEARAQSVGTETEAAERSATGLWLTTRYPELSGQAGQDISIDLSLTNKGMPPQRVGFDVSGLPDGWTWQLNGGGRQIAAAIASPDETVDLTLKLTPPADAPTKTYEFAVTGTAEGRRLELPMALTLTEIKPAKLTLEPELPALRGTPRSSFDFQVTMKNEGERDTVVNLLSQAPQGFEVTFKERYGSQELTSIPLKAGESKNLSVNVDPPEKLSAGQYEVMIRAAGDNATADSRLVLDVTGSPSLTLSGPEGRLSGNATAGEARTFNFTLRNTGTAPAESIKFSSSPPSGWKVEFDPEKIDQIPPGGSADVAISMTPSNQAIAGDYVVTVRANGEGVSDSADFRVTVRTSTLWGVAGLGVIGAAVVVLALAVTRYGRR